MFKSDLMIKLCSLMEILINVSDVISSELEGREGIV